MGCRWMFCKCSRRRPVSSKNTFTLQPMPVNRRWALLGTFSKCNTVMSSLGRSPVWWKGRRKGGYGVRQREDGMVGGGLVRR